MTWKVDQGLSIGYCSCPVATVSEELLFEAGEITLLLGLNSQGKSTFMKTWPGLIPPVTAEERLVWRLEITPEKARTTEDTEVTEVFLVHAMTSALNFASVVPSRRGQSPQNAFSKSHF